MLAPIHHLVIALDGAGKKNRVLVSLIILFAFARIHGMVPNFKPQITLEDLKKIDIRVRIDPHKRTCNQQPSHLPNGRQPGNWAVTAEDSLRKSASEARLKRRGRLTDSQSVGWRGETYCVFLTN
jgi:hypothetical protein